MNIIPTPKKYEKKNGSFSLRGISIFMEDSLDPRVKKALTVLSEDICRVTGERVTISSATPSGRCIVLSAGSGDTESYSVKTDTERCTVSSEGAAGAFYAVQSLRQAVALEGDSLPCFELFDEPDLGYRGFYQDITRGRVNSLKKLKDIADKLSYYKINSLQLYVEDSFMFKEFEGIITVDEALTPDEILELDTYCWEHFIELVPSLSTFGHLFTLLQSDRFNYISELGEHKMGPEYWMEKQWHHTVDVYHPDTIKVIGSMIEQYIPLFRSDKFNICCDETMDLCNGRNKGRDKGEAYFHHVDQLIAIVKSHGKKVMLWGDECMAHSELAKAHLPEDAVILNWNYGHVQERIPKFFSDLGFKQIVCPGTISWSKFIENIDASEDNISTFASFAKKYGALGILNTNWGDFGHPCSFNCNLFGMVFGAQKGWNIDADMGETFKKTASDLLYGIKEIDLSKTVYKLGQAELSADWFRFVMWHCANCYEGRNTELTFSEDGSLSAADAIRHIDDCKKEIERLSPYGDNVAISDIIIAAEAIILMNRLYLFANEAEGFTDREVLQADFDRWLLKYEAAWLRDDKPSQLWRISDFVKKITNIPTGNKNT